MHLTDRSRSAATHRGTRRGLTLIEILVVVAIIGLLLALLFPAVQKARERARDMVCKNNLHQINIAIGDFTNVHKRIPGPGAQGTVGGWTIELLPFLEQKNLHDQAKPGTPIANASVMLLRRPRLYECPVQLSQDSASNDMDRSHYVLVPSRARKTCAVYDAPIELNEPWASGPEVSVHTFEETTGPHHGGFLWVSLSRGVEFRAGK
jgi:prepilin-type N-terminal cleavage/methylation domain-containing protein